MDETFFNRVMDRIVEDLETICTDDLYDWWLKGFLCGNSFEVSQFDWPELISTNDDPWNIFKDVFDRRDWRILTTINDVMWELNSCFDDWIIRIANIYIRFSPEKAENSRHVFKMALFLGSKSKIENHLSHKISIDVISRLSLIEQFLPLLFNSRIQGNDLDTSLIIAFFKFSYFKKGSAVLSSGNEEGAPTEKRERRNGRNRAENGIDLPFASQAFKDAWEDWIKYRSELRKPLKPSTVAAQLKQLSAMGEVIAIEAISQSIRQGWQGLFEPKGQNGRPQSTAKRLPTVEEALA